MCSIKNIIFDIGNVISRFDWEGTYRSKGYEGSMLERLGKATARSDDWKEYDRGILTAEQVLERFIENDPEIEEEIRHALSEFSLIVKPVEYAIPWIKSLKQKGYRCYYLSNFSEIAEKECREALAFLPLMDGGILSWHEKVIKPDPAIYRLLLDRYDLKPEIAATGESASAGTVAGKYDIAPEIAADGETAQVSAEARLLAGQLGRLSRSGDLGPWEML